MTTKAIAERNLNAIANTTTALSSADLWAAWSKTKGADAMPDQEDVGVLKEAEATNPGPIRIATHLKCYGETADVKMSAILNQVDDMINIGNYSSISKSGKMFKTIRIPKAIMSMPRPKREGSPVMILIQMSNLLWRSMLPEVRPPRLFTVSMLGMFKAMVGTKPNYTLTNTHVRAIIQAIAANNPNLLKLYQLQRQFTAQAKATMDTIKQELATRRATIQQLANNLVNDVQSGSYVIGQLMELLNKSALLERSPLDEQFVKDLLAKVGTGGVSRPIAGHGRSKKFAGAMNLTAEDALLTGKGLAIKRRTLGRVFPSAQKGGTARAIQIAEGIRRQLEGKGVQTSVNAGAIQEAGESAFEQYQAPQKRQKLPDASGADDLDISGMGMMEGITG